MTERKINYNEIRKNFYKTYTEEELKKQLKNYINQELDLSNFDDKGKKYDKIINNFFQKDIYSAISARGVKETLSPQQALESNELLDKIFGYINSKPKFYAGNDVENLKSFFRNGGKWAGKVANFSPNVARKIYEFYCPKQNANILDYSCGFGSRMLGCLTSKYNYNYYGIDPNTKLNLHLKQLGEFIKTQKECIYKLFCQGSEDFIEELTNKIDLAFSSPPYFNWEIYTNEETQSIEKFSNYNDWLNIYVKNTLKNIHKYLKCDGKLLINIKNLTRSKNNPKLFDDWLKMAVSNGFELISVEEMKHQSGKTAIQKYQNEILKNKYNYKGIKEPLIILKKI